MKDVWKEDVKEQTFATASPSWALEFFEGLEYPGAFDSPRLAALFFFDQGATVVPIDAGTKRPTVGWEWLKGQSREEIAEHWSLHPDQEVGCILGDHLVVRGACDLATLEKVARDARPMAVKLGDGALIIQTEPDEAVVSFLPLPTTTDSVPGPLTRRYS